MLRSASVFNHAIFLACSVLYSSVSFVALANQQTVGITLKQAIQTAQQNDPWFIANQLQRQATLDKSQAADALPDPTMSLSLLNLPTDGWDFNQEAMTQFKVGINQRFPRGETLAIAKDKLEIQAQKYPVLREHRQAQLALMVSQAWLDAFEAEQNIALINSERGLFEQMVEIANANYASASGKTRQTDVISAQLELIRLEDRLTVQQQKHEVAMAKLNQWLLTSEGQNHFASNYARTQFHRVSAQLPNLHSAVMASLLQQPKVEDIAELVVNHPLVKAIDINQRVANKDIALAEQQFKPQWGVNASYAYRADTPNNQSRADFFSLGVSFDLPLFTNNLQDKHLSASKTQAEAIKSEKLMQMQQLIVEVQTQLKHLARLKQRQRLYQGELTAQSHEQAEAALTAYTNDDGDFAEVLQARLSELNIKIAALKIQIDTLKTQAQLQYLLHQSQQQNTPL
ncbi:TolC family protein [Thalassotalea aquiviva]|uniref:TolC family protein n=1 Tax=Thalassotalea aquiviva TaxID=3242415 RepID=UPI00352B8FFF